MEQQYGRYRIKKQLGKGTMGVVYLAHDPQIDRLVALKVLRPDRVVSEDFVQRFLKEARAIGRLAHPNIVVVYDIGRDHGTIYIAMEYLEGRPFNTVIKSGKPDYATWAKVGMQLAETLAYAHENGIVHRDIKPSNIIMTTAGHIKLTDFGIARIEDPDATLQTHIGDILGTPAYMAPEQVAGRAVDGRSDLFSLGVILYEWLLGQRPFVGKNMAAVFSAISNKQPPSPKDIDPRLPSQLADLLIKCLQKLPGDRFQDGRQMAAAIKDGLNQLQRVEMRKKSAATGTKRLKWAIIGIVLLTTAGFFSGLPLVSHLAQWFKSPTPSVEAPTHPSSTPDADMPPIDATPPISKQVTDEKPVEIVRSASLKVTSVPPGAQLLIDDVPKGVTPSNLTLPLGTYKLRLTLPAHYGWSAAVQLDDGVEMPLNVRLVPIE